MEIQELRSFQFKIDKQCKNQRPYQRQVNLSCLCQFYSKLFHVHWFNIDTAGAYLLVVRVTRQYLFQSGEIKKKRESYFILTTRDQAYQWPGYILKRRLHSSLPFYHNQIMLQKKKTNIGFNVFAFAQRFVKRHHHR